MEDICCILLLDTFLYRRLDNFGQYWSFFPFLVPTVLGQIEWITSRKSNLKSEVESIEIYTEELDKLTDKHSRNDLDKNLHKSIRIKIAYKYVYGRA